MCSSDLHERAVSSGKADGCPGVAWHTAWRRWLAGGALLIGACQVRPANAISLSATSASGFGNSMGLAIKTTLLDPGVASYVGSPSLAAPVIGFTNTDMLPNAPFGTGLTDVQMKGFAQSSIFQPTAGEIGRAHV